MLLVSRRPASRHSRHSAFVAAGFLFWGCCAASAQDANTPAIQPAYAERLLTGGLRLGTAFECDVNRLLRLNQPQFEQQSPAKYDFTKYVKGYLETATSPETILSEISASAFGASIRSARDGMTPKEFDRHFAESLTRKSIAGSIDFLTASLLQQDVRMVESNAHGIRNRIRYAFLQSFVVRGREGDELAVSRIAASFGTAWVLSDWNPWLKKNERPSIEGQAAIIFGHYVARSFWTEFRPDFKHEVRTILGRDTIFTRP